MAEIELKDETFNRRLIANEFAKKINSNKIKQIILYGSVARGDDTNDSDIDILIISDYYDEIEPRIRKIVTDIILNKHELISAHIMSTEHYNNTKEYSFLSNVLKDGVILV